MFKQIKIGLTTNPFKTTWKLCLFPFIFLAAALFYIVIALFNLGFEEANDFWSETF
jgi:hypothetical protein